MTTFALPQITERVESPVASAVREGLDARPKRLPAWLFYDADGSDLFEQITRLPEYYLTRTEREIFAAHAAEIIARAAQFEDADATRLRIAELGAGSADKTRLLLKAAVDRQQTLVYEPVDVSASALEAARERIEREIAGVEVSPRVLDYTQGLDLEPAAPGERRLVLYIGSSIGNFEPHQAELLLQGIRAGLEPGDTLLLGVDLRKNEHTLLAAYDDASGVTARFNLNVLARLNRELAADFDLEAFAHRAVWNPDESRIEMHLESLTAQRVRVRSLDLEVKFGAGESIHTENSYKYAPGHAEAMLSDAGFDPESTWTDPKEWFAVCLARAQ
ncbi:MAG TPA: L-histidine N(alpha)-methyltransferase [Terracidiphilus sp.]|jgi:dimethylhistidine N-methyltransferase